jgi:hypothetical protein
MSAVLSKGLSFQQLPEEAEGRPPVSSRLHENDDRVAVFVDGPPEILPLPLDGHEHLIQIPRVAYAASAARSGTRGLYAEVVSE